MKHKDKRVILVREVDGKVQAFPSASVERRLGTGWRKATPTESKPYQVADDETAKTTEKKGV